MRFIIMYWPIVPLLILIIDGILIYTELSRMKLNMRVPGCNDRNAFHIGVRKIMYWGILGILSITLLGVFGIALNLIDTEA